MSFLITYVNNFIAALTQMKNEIPVVATLTKWVGIVIGAYIAFVVIMLIKDIVGAVRTAQSQSKNSNESFGVARTAFRIIMDKSGALVIAIVSILVISWFLGLLGLNITGQNGIVNLFI
jgi:hypothetical protein